MQNKQIEKLFRDFTQSKLSKKTQRRFLFWLRYDRDEDKIVEHQMYQLWSETDGQVSDSTFAALARARIHIDSQRKRYSILKTVSKYTAIVAASVVCSIGFYKFSFQEPEMNEPIFMNELFVHNGECKHLTLIDGSEVWLDAGSILVYPNRFENERREIYLIGQARFKVHPNKHSPFIVKTKFLDVEALGTVFSVQSYPELKSVSTILEEGSILVTTERIQEASISHILKPDERLVFYPQSDSIAIEDVDAKRLSKWIDGNLIFQDAGFEEIIKKLERKYNVRINYDVSKFAGRKYYIRINQEESITDALSLLKYLIQDFNYVINDSVITIY